MGVAPAAGFKNCKLELRTQFSSNSSKPLKEVRVVTSSFTLEESGQDNDPTLRLTGITGRCPASLTPRPRQVTITQ